VYYLDYSKYLSSRKYYTSGFNILLRYLAENDIPSDEIFIYPDILMFSSAVRCRKKAAGSITTRMYETFLAIREPRQNGCRGIEEKKKREYQVGKIESAASQRVERVPPYFSDLLLWVFHDQGSTHRYKGLSSTRFHANTRA